MITAKKLPRAPDLARGSWSPGAPQRWPAADLALMLGTFALLAAPVLYLQLRSGYPVDLAVYRQAGLVALHLGDPYAGSFAQHLRVPLPFTYPPFASLVMIPLALVPLRVGLWAWTAINLSLVGLLAWWLLGPTLRGSRCPARHQPLLVGLGAGLLVWTVPVAQTLGYGQVNILLACACLLDCTGSPRRRGVLVGLATAIKLTPGLFIGYFLATRQWAAAVRATLTAGACAVLTAVLLPRPSRQFWLHLVLDPSRPGNPGLYFNQSLYGALVRAGAPVGVWPVLALATCGVGLWRASRAHAGGAEVAAVGLVGLSAVLISPISWQHHAVWVCAVLAVLLAWALNPVDPVNPGRPVRVAAVAAVLLLLVVPVPRLGRLLVRSGRMPLLAQLVQDGDVLLFAGLLAALPLVPLSQRGASPAPQAAPSPALGIPGGAP